MSGEFDLEKRDIRTLVEQAFASVTNIKEIDPAVELTDQGLDSLGATQFITTIEEGVGMELDADLLFDFPLMDQLVGFLESKIGIGGTNRGRTAPLDRGEIESLVNRLFYELTLIEKLDRDVELTDQGLDSMSATQFLTELESELHVPLDAEVLFDYPLFDQLVNHLVDQLRVASV